MELLKKIRFLFCLSVLLVVTNMANAQGTQVTGVVSDAQGGVPGATVQVKGTSTGTITDIDGFYSLTINKENAVLIFSFVGLVTQEVEVAGRSVIDVEMQNDVLALDEVVVVGYGTLKKSDLTGAVSSVKEKDLQSIPVADAAQALQGRVPGVQINQSDPSPGSNATIKIRGINSVSGANAPLVVIDGYTNAGDLSSINPRDIKSIEVLKDASATAIYGSRGANGVILITTKEGVSGDLKVSVISSTSLREVRKKLDMYDSREFMTLRNEVLPGEFEPSEIDNAINTDWQDEIYRNTIMRNDQVTIRGGGEKSTFMLSLNALNDQGVVQNSDFQRYSIRNRVGYQLAKNLNIDNTMYFANSKTNATPRNTPGFAADPSASDAALKFWPYLPVKEDGEYVHMLDVANPVSVTKERDDINKKNFFYNYAQLEWKPLPGLSLKSTLGVTLDNEINQSYWSSEIKPVTTAGIAAQNSDNELRWTNENIVNYSKDFNRHKFVLTGAYTMEYKRNEGFYAQSSGFISDDLKYNNLEGGSSSLLSSYFSEETLNSYLGRLFYGYDSRYLLTASIRADGSSKFGANNKWGFFPAFSAAWNLGNESFLKGSSNFSTVKLRGGWGVTGNSASLDRYQTLNGFNIDPRVKVIFSDIAQQVLARSRLGNPDLKWETTTQYNIGIDLGFLGERISFVGDVFYKTTADMIYAVNLPSAFSPVRTRFENVAELENKGFEFRLTTLNIEKREFEWQSTLNFSLFRNKILKLNDDKDFQVENKYEGLVSDHTSIVKVGEPLGSFYGYYANGIFADNNEGEGISYTYLPNQSNREGYIHLRDINQDGFVNQEDRTIIGTAQPDFYFGLSNNVKYRSFDFTLFLDASIGGQIYNVSRFNLENTNANFNVSQRVENRWTPENRNTDVAKAGGFINIGNSSFIEDATYVKVRDIQLGYTFPSTLMERINIDHLRVFVSAQNYFVFTGYTGYDPEVNARGNSVTAQGIDLGGYPSSKQITFGLNLDF